MSASLHWWMVPLVLFLMGIGGFVASIVQAMRDWNMGIFMPAVGTFWLICCWVGAALFSLGWALK